MKGNDMKTTQSDVDAMAETAIRAGLLHAISFGKLRAAVKHLDEQAVLDKLTASVVQQLGVRGFKVVSALGPRPGTA